jgi:hypothetical protein
MYVLVAGGSAPAQQTSNDSPPASAKVIILQPQVVFEQLTNKSVLTQNVTFESALTNAATASLSARKYTVVTLESLQQVDAIDLLKQLQPLTSRLARGAINDEAQQTLRYLAAFPDDYLILVQFMRVKEGPGGSWNPYSGAITSSMSSTLLQASLISTHTGQVVWKNEVLERKVFRANDPNFAKYLDLLYGTLAIRGGNQ